MARGISVILLTWNGLTLLKECLPKVVSNLSRWSMPHELIIVDNGSRDGTIEYLAGTYPEVPCVKFAKNRGFAQANNAAVKQTCFDTILFLNNDLYLEEDFISALYGRLDEDKVFAVAPKILRWDKVTIDDGLRYGRYTSGLFSAELEKERERFAKSHWVTFFCGACFLCKKEIFTALEGFDTLYTPYAWEDLDLAYRAWKRGYKIAYEPRSVAYHKREATTRSAFSNLFFISLMWKNKFIFTWKNITSRKMIMAHLAWLPLKMLKFLCNGRWRYVVGFLRALPHVPAILIKRMREKRYAVLSDEEVLRSSYTMITN
jgi:GT2 family glycosyltransferase